MTHNEIEGRLELAKATLASPPAHSSASAAGTACLLQIGLRGSLFTPTDVSQSLDLGYDVVTRDEWAAMGTLINSTVSRIGGSRVFLSFDLDVVDPAFAPGVQTPEAGGPSSSEVLGLLRKLPCLQIVGADVVEGNPLFDGAGQITASLAATVAP